MNQCVAHSFSRMSQRFHSFYKIPAGLLLHRGQPVKITVPGFLGAAAKKQLEHLKMIIDIIHHPGYVLLCNLIQPGWLLFRRQRSKVPVLFKQCFLPRKITVYGSGCHRCLLCDSPERRFLISICEKFLLSCLQYGSNRTVVPVLHDNHSNLFPYHYNTVI